MIRVGLARARDIFVRPAAAGSARSLRVPLAGLVILSVQLGFCVASAGAAEIVTFTPKAEPAVVLARGERDYPEQLRPPPRTISYIASPPPQALRMEIMGRPRDLGLEAGPYGADEITGSVGAVPAKAAPAIKRLPQVDLYGRNLPDMPIQTRSADECEARCTAKEACAAFTFNTARSACFLKASAEVALSHPATISGLREGFKKRIRRTRLTIQEATDYPGNDIDRQTGTTFDACLISCSKARTCKAFTYVIHRHECWLKNGVGSAEPRDGLVSGIK